MTDAATTLAEEIKARHLSSHGSCAFCSTRTDDLPWPCDAVRAAGMLLELARDGARHSSRLAAVTLWLETNEPSVFRRGLWDAVYAADAARNATQEKP